MGYGFYRDEEVSLPHKPLPLAVFLVVEDAIRVAWQILKKRPSQDFDIQQAVEDSVTLELYKILYNEVFDRGLVDGFDDQRFNVGTRESKIPNFDGKKPDLMPDMLIAVRGRGNVYDRTQDWLFIECKPVDEEHTVGVHYGAKGIARFIRGDYAWAMTNGLMVAYCSPDYTIEPKLSNALRSRGKEFKTIGKLQKCNRSQDFEFAECVCRTEHGRDFNYRETGKAAPPILLRHLWLLRD